MRWKMSGLTRVAAMAGYRPLLTPPSAINSTEVRLKLPQRHWRPLQDCDTKLCMDRVTRWHGQLSRLKTEGADCMSSGHPTRSANDGNGWKADTVWPKSCISAFPHVFLMSLKKERRTRIAHAAREQE